MRLVIGSEYHALQSVVLIILGNGQHWRAAPLHHPYRIAAEQHALGTSGTVRTHDDKIHTYSVTHLVDPVNEVVVIDHRVELMLWVRILGFDGGDEVVDGFFRRID